jgi:hypothetical protein
LNTPNHDNIDYWIFDWIEGNLSAEQEEQLQIFLLLNPEYEADVEAWKSTKISVEQPSSHVDYSATLHPEKKKKKRRFLLWINAMLIPLLFMLSDSDAPNIKPSLVRNKMFIAKNDHENAQNFTPKQEILDKIKLNTKASNKSQTTEHIAETPVAVPVYTPSRLSFFQDHQSDSSLDLNVKKEVGEHLTPTLPLLKASLIEQAALDSLALSNTNINSSEEREIEASKKREHRFRKIIDHSALSSFVKKASVNNTQKDRVYVLQEKTHVDLHESTAGNLSQTRFQSATFLRDLNTSNEKISQQISIDGYLRSMKSGLGVVANFSNFNNGAIKDWNLRLIYAPKIALSRYITLEPSVSYLFGNKSLNSSKILNQTSFTFQSNYVQEFTYNPNYPIGDQLFYRDLNAGLMMNIGPIYLGASSKNLFRHQDNIHTNDISTIGRSLMEHSVILGTDFSAHRGELRFSPSLLHEFNSAYKTTQIGASIQWKDLVVGANIGTRETFSGLIGYHKENVSILAQSTRTTQLISQKSMFIHQVTVRISSKISRKSRRYISL